MRPGPSATAAQPERGCWIGWGELRMARPEGKLKELKTAELGTSRARDATWW